MDGKIQLSPLNKNVKSIIQNIENKYASNHQGDQNNI